MDTVKAMVQHDDFVTNPALNANLLAKTFSRGTKQDGWNEYMLYGGLPPIMNISNPEEKINILKTLFEETYISDIVGRLDFLHVVLKAVIPPVRTGYTRPYRGFLRLWRYDSRLWNAHSNVLPVIESTKILLILQLTRQISQNIF